jgi:hypothetical protein
MDKSNPKVEMRFQRLERAMSQLVQLDVGIEVCGLLDKFFGRSFEFLDCFENDAMKIMAETACWVG